VALRLPTLTSVALYHRQDDQTGYSWSGLHVVLLYYCLYVV